MKNFRDSNILLINVVDFYRINQVYSPTIGDKVLVEIAQRLKKFSQNVYRLYGDRFALAKEKGLYKRRSYNGAVWDFGRGKYL